VDYTAIQNALNSSNPATALNPFVAGPLRFGGKLVLQPFFSDAYTTYTGRGVVIAVDGYVRGPLLRLPLGREDIELLMGAQYDRGHVVVRRGQTMCGFDPPNTRRSLERRSHAAFAEARIPIVGSRSGSSSGDILAGATGGAPRSLQRISAARILPRLGVEWRPF